MHYSYYLLIVLVIIIVLLTYYNSLTVSNFTMDAEFLKKSKELFDRGASFTEFRSVYNIDNVEYVDLKEAYMNNKL